jgi:hypothetical protein
VVVDERHDRHPVPQHLDRLGVVGDLRAAVDDDVVQRRVSASAASRSPSNRM